MSRDFFYLVFLNKQLLLVPLEISLGHFDFFIAFISISISIYLLAFFFVNETEKRLSDVASTGEF